MQVAKKPTYVYINFLLHYVITVYQRYRQTDRQTDVMLVA